MKNYIATGCALAGDTVIVEPKIIVADNQADATGQIAAMIPKDAQEVRILLTPYTVEITNPL